MPSTIAPAKDRAVTVNGQTITIATLQTLNLARLFDGDHAEVTKMLTAAETDGFFYLDVRDWNNGSMLHDLDAANSLVKKWFELPSEEKKKTVTLSDAHGYKPLGQQSGVTEKSRDGHESLRISRTSMVQSGHPLPTVAEENYELFRSYQFTCHRICKMIISRLSDLCGIMAEEDRLENFHDDNEGSRSALSFQHHPPSPENGGVGHNAHTDVGTLTLLITKQWGLQVLSPLTNEWEYVQPRPGYAVVNVGDTLRFLSNLRFRSGLHRVLPIGGKSTVDRYSTIYFLRGADTATFESLDGKKLNAEEWFHRKFNAFTRPLEEMRKDGLAFGGMDKALGVRV